MTRVVTSATGQRVTAFANGHVIASGACTRSIAGRISPEMTLPPRYRVGDKVTSRRACWITRPAEDGETGSAFRAVR